jgi:uncharacterized SAM-dependent methyltransferase
VSLSELVSALDHARARTDALLAQLDDEQLTRSVSGVEISTKFRRARLERDAGSAGLRLESWWTDAAGDFALVLLSGKER